jgi:hypothetical protein
MKVGNILSITKGASEGTFCPKYSVRGVFYYTIHVLSQLKIDNNTNKYGDSVARFRLKIKINVL